MMCLKTFTEKSLSDFNSFDEWKEFVNENYVYSQTHSKPFDYKGKCKESDLPSFHPYWYNIVKQNLHKDLDVLNERYAQCSDNPDKIKYYFNLTTSIDMIKEMKKDLELRCEGVVWY